ncbi:hypothetical protein PpBr36_03890 [Pyricularia pennisetigena]|uniref:hypothetical protein n=1 Tax=Pyricularia pennisetigena TaxID=1578925 RepID=UPI00114FA2E6|nr:hypothetical protein PpBr36_03890 [Pyricularia pennisetigena]TLS30806.1 hypothetical protein PpBr36_03890 [Pyricularia pennisetigena]
MTNNLERNALAFLLSVAKTEITTKATFPASKELTTSFSHFLGRFFTSEAEYPQTRQQHPRNSPHGPPQHPQQLEHPPGARRPDKAHSEPQVDKKAGAPLVRTASLAEMGPGQDRVFPSPHVREAGADAQVVV